MECDHFRQEASVPWPTRVDEVACRIVRSGRLAVQAGREGSLEVRKTSESEFARGCRQVLLPEEVAVGADGGLEPCRRQIPPRSREIGIVRTPRRRRQHRLGGCFTDQGVDLVEDAAYDEYRSSPAVPQALAERARRLRERGRCRTPCFEKRRSSLPGVDRLALERGAPAYLPATDVIDPVQVRRTGGENLSGEPGVRDERLLSRRLVDRQAGKADQGERDVRSFSAHEPRRSGPKPPLTSEHPPLVASIHPFITKPLSTGVPSGIRPPASAAPGACKQPQARGHQ